MTVKEKIKFLRPQIHFGIEKWKYCMALDIYVSSLGRIKDKNGVLQTVGVKDNYLVYKGKLVHRLVMQTFNPVPNYANLTVDHLNHNTRDNSLKNLEWVTKEENTKRAKEDQAAHAVSASSAESTPVTKVFMNGVKVEFDIAKALMLADKSLSSNPKGVLETFEKVKKAANPTVSIKFGNYVLRKCED